MQADRLKKIHKYIQITGMLTGILHTPHAKANHNTHTEKGPYKKFLNKNINQLTPS